MGQNNCKCADQYLRHVQAPKCSLLDQEMLSQFEIPDKQNFQCCIDTSKYFQSQPSKLPSRYTDLYMILRNTSKKYNDIFFSPENWFVPSQSQLPQGHVKKEQEWVRISQKKDKIRQNFEKKDKSSFCAIYEFIQQKHPSLWQKIKPIYLEKVGFAICTLYLCGQKRQVIVDDRIPIKAINEKVNGLILLMQKAFAKAVGCYDYLSLFSMGQIFSETTGIPTIVKSQFVSEEIDKQNKCTNNQAKTYSTFKDALTCDEVLFQTKRFHKEEQMFGVRDKFQVSSVSFSGSMSLLKIHNPVQQILSLRIVQRSAKYLDGKQRRDSYPPIFAQMFQQKDKRLTRVGGGMRMGNNLYIKGQFMNIQAGVYFLFVRQFEKNQTLSLLAYSKEQIKFNQIYDPKTISGIQFKNIRSQYPISSLQYTQILPNIKAAVKFYPNKTAIMFQKNYPKKAMRVLKNGLHIQIEGQERKKVEKLWGVDNILGKWVIIYNCNEDGNIGVCEQFQMIDI